MPELTQEQKYYRTKRREIYLRWVIVAAVGIIIYLSIRGCQGEQSASVAYNAIEKRVKDLLADSSRIAAIARAKQNEINDLDLHIADLVADLNITKGVLIDESDKVRRLANEVKRAKADKDTVRYYDQCDSLANESLNKDIYLAKAWGQAAKIDSMRVAQLKNKDSLIEHYQTAYEKCIGAIVYIDNALPSLKPTNKVYFTGGGYSVGPSLGAVAGFTFVSKKGFVIAAKGMAANTGLGALVEVGVPLSFKRKN